MLFFRSEDLGLRRFFAGGRRVGEEALRELAAGLVGRNKLVVLFDDVGYRTLSVRLVEEGDLLRPAEG